MINSIWSVTGGGLSAPTNIWGIVGMTRERENVKTGEVKFRIPGAMDVSPPIFPVFSPFKSLDWSTSAVSIKRNGVLWFQGLCTEVPRRGSARDEDMQYVISDPWWFLENCTFQQQWQAITGGVGGGLGAATQSTTVSRILACQSLDGTKINLGQLIQEVLIYALYAAQGVPFPGVVQENSLPAYPVPGPLYPAPFLIGTVTPTLIVPYFEVRDRTCAQIIQHVMRYIPDTIGWFDHTTTPPTLNFDTRANLANKTIQLYGTSLRVNGYKTSGWNPTAMTKLQVPAVIAKYEASEHLDGKDAYVVWVDKYPANAPDNAIGALVQTVDLIGTAISLAKQTVTVISRPTSTSSAAQALGWLLRDDTQLSQYDISLVALNAGRLGLDPTKITCMVDPASPILQSPIRWPANGAGLNYELIDGAVTPWMYDQDGLVCADAAVTIPLTYTGSDAATLAYFNGQPTPGTLLLAVRTKITNAGDAVGWVTQPDTNEYSTVASFQQGETAPVGYAEALWIILSQLHQKGTLEITERECSDMLPVGAIFNTSDGLPEWQTMNALVLSVREDIDKGITTVECGPTLHLGLDEMVELRRANTGRLLSYAMNQRTTGQTSSASQIQGHNQSAARSVKLPPGGTSVQVGPFTITYGSNGNYTYWVTVQLNGIFLNWDGSAVTLTSLTKANLNGNDTLWIYGDVTQDAAGNPWAPAALIRSYGNGNNDLANQNAYNVTGGLTENDGGSPPNQTKYRKVLATFVAGNNGQPVLTTRQTTTNLQMQQKAINSSAATTAVASTYPGTI